MAVQNLRFELYFRFIRNKTYKIFYTPHGDCLFNTKL